MLTALQRKISAIIYLEIRHITGPVCAFISNSDVEIYKRKVRFKLYYLLAALVGFLSGSIMYSYYLPLLLKKVDVVALSEDHNPGTSNAMLYAGKPMGLLCLCLDFQKGYVPILASIYLLNPEHLLFAVVIVAPVLGHAFSPFLKFHGGKAIATTFGVLVALWPVSRIVLALGYPLIFLTFILTLNPHSLSVILAAMFLGVSAYLWGGSTAIVAGVMVIAVVLIYKHVKGYNKEPISLRLFMKIPLYQQKRQIE